MKAKDTEVKIESIQIKVGNTVKTLGPGNPCFVVAELSANHGQNLSVAEDIIRSAARAGADAIKLQTYLPETMTLDSEEPWFMVSGESTPGDWKNRKLFDLYREAYTPWEWHPQLKALTESLGMVFFSTPFDSTAVDFLEKLNVPLYKIASYEVTHLPLLRLVAKTGKPVIMSTGFANLSEISLAVETLRESGCKQIALLHCITNYANDPAPENSHLSNIKDLSEKFKVITGFSDNTKGIEIPIVAVHAGACILEKHVVADRTDGALDSSFSLKESELSEMVNRIRFFEKTLGIPIYGSLNKNEEYFRFFRRSIIAVRDIAPGDRLKQTDVSVLRPACGLDPKHLDGITGKVAKAFIKRGTPIQWELFQ